MLKLGHAHSRLNLLECLPCVCFSVCPCTSSRSLSSVLQLRHCTRRSGKRASAQQHGMKRARDHRHQPRHGSTGKPKPSRLPENRLQQCFPQRNFQRPGQRALPRHRRSMRRRNPLNRRRQLLPTESASRQLGRRGERLGGNCASERRRKRLVIMHRNRDRPPTSFKLAGTVILGDFWDKSLAQFAGRVAPTRNVSHPPRRIRSVRLQTGEPDHLAPLVGFVGDQFAEIRA